MLNMDKFGKLITDKRKKAGLTQDSFAAQLGITPQAVSKWENGLTYPDVTLFPQIAQILNVPIATLFGEENEGSSNKKTNDTRFADSYRSMPLVYKTEKAACYSVKTIMKIDQNSLTVFFTDGSYADLAQYIVKNCGAGDIYIKRAEVRDDDEIDESSPNDITESLEKFDTIRLSVSCSCDVYINEDKNRRITAKGSKRFIASLKYQIKDKELCIEVKPKNNSSVRGNNRIDIFADFSRGKGFYVVINGSGLCKCAPIFENASISINGSGDVHLSEVGELRTTVNGSGDVDVKKVTRRADLSVNGSGDMNIGYANDVKMSVNGAGDLNIGQACGELYIKVAGAADVSAAGKVDKLYCKISGSGDIKCGELTVQEAEIYADNAAHIHIGHIVRTSIEKLGMMTELKVDKRG